MKIQREQLQETYRELETERLIQLRAQGALTPEAQSVLDEELSIRGIDETSPDLILTAHSNVEESSSFRLDPSARKKSDKRPWPIWLLAGFILYSIGSALILNLAAYVGLGPVEIKTAVRDMGVATQIVGIIQLLLYGAAAVLLFQMSRLAPLMFLISLTVGIVVIGTNLAFLPQYLEMAQRNYFAPIIGGQLIKLIALIYSYSLKRKGRLS